MVLEAPVSFQARELQIPLMESLILSRQTWDLTQSHCNMLILIIAKDNASRIINVYETPTADFIVDKAVICQDSFVVVEYNGSITSGGSYNWTFGNDVMTRAMVRVHLISSGPIRAIRPSISPPPKMVVCLNFYQLDVEVDQRYLPCQSNVLIKKRPRLLLDGIA